MKTNGLWRRGIERLQQNDDVETYRVGDAGEAIVDVRGREGNNVGLVVGRELQVSRGVVRVLKDRQLIGCIRGKVGDVQRCADDVLVRVDVE